MALWPQHPAPARALKTARIALTCAPHVVLWLHAASLGRWIVDDAGITFAFARSVAHGEGFRLGHGGEVVEGLTNLAWMVLLVPFFWLDAMDPVWTAKALGLLAASLGLVLVRRAALAADAPGPWTDGGLLLAALNPALAIWVTSGLENGLTVLVVASLVWWTARTSKSAGGPAAKHALIAGALGFAAATVRPDALVFAGLWPGAQLLRGRAGLRPASIAGFTTVGLLALLTWWRWTTFGDLVPNTFRAKGGDSRFDAFGAAIVLGLGLRPAILRDNRLRLVSVAGCVIAAATWCGQTPLRAVSADGTGALLLAGALLWWHRPGDRARRDALGLCTLLALVQVVAMPPDWMGEHRFATAWVVLGSVLAMLGAGVIWRTRVTPCGRGATVIALALVAVAAFTGVRHVRRSSAFRVAPTLSMATVQERFEATFGTWVHDVPQEHRVVMLPDIGGVLWSDCARILDLAGLCHREVARYVFKDRDALRRLILEDLRPPFLGMHGHWAWASGLPGHPDFEADYEPIAAGTDALLSELAGVELESGSYVRRDLQIPQDVMARWRRAPR